MSTKKHPRTLSDQMADMKSQGYAVFPASLAEGMHDTDTALSSILNFSGSHMASHLGHRTPSPDPMSAAGGFMSTADAIPVGRDAQGNEIGTPGKGYIPWGINNNLPNTVALVNSQLVYTALCVKFNVDVLTGLGVEPVYEFHSTVGCNENEDTLSYQHAGSYIQKTIERLRSKMFNMLKEHVATPLTSPQGGTTDPAATTLPSASARSSSAAPSVGMSRGDTEASAADIPVITHPSQRPAPAPEGSPDGADDLTDTFDVAALHAPDGMGYRRYADTLLDDMIVSSRAQIRNLEKAYKVWARTNSKLQQFSRNHNAARFAHDLATDMVQYNMCFVELQLSQDATRQRDSALWKPTITGLRYRDALTCRLEEKDDMGVSRYVYISNCWLDPLNHSELQHADICAIPALDPSAPLPDLTQRIRQYRSEAASARDRLANYEQQYGLEPGAAPLLTAEGTATIPDGYDPAYHAQLIERAAYYANPANRPCRFILPIDYRTSGRFYYPQPAYWSIYKDIYEYASNIIRDRAIRKKNENMFTYVLYVHQGYLNQLTNQLNAQKTEKEKEAIKQAEIRKIKDFLANKQNNGSTLAACTFVGQDGKDHDAFKVERIDYANSKQNAEADKTEITDMASLICFGFECHPDLIGATPGVSSNGGTYQREMLLINQTKKANMQQILLSPYFLARDFNGFDQNLTYKVRQKTLTTLDASKTGTVEE